MERVILGVAIVVTILIPVLFLLNKKIKQKFVIYLPSIIMFCLGIIFYLWGKFYAEPMQDLGMYVVSLICTVVAIILAIIALIIRQRKKK